MASPLTLPNTNIVATASSTLDFGNLATAATLGRLSLAGSLTVQDVAAGGSVQFGGDVVGLGQRGGCALCRHGQRPSLVLAGNQQHPEH